jgi:hypothetical protein
MLIVLGMLFGFAGVVMLAIAANQSSGRPEVMIMTVIVFVLMVVLFGTPIYLFGNQDVSLGRKLLTQGIVRDARVAKVTWEGTFAFVGVDVDRDGETKRFTFRCGISEGFATSLEGKTIPFVSLPSAPNSVGIAIEGLGLFTTR